MSSLHGEFITTVEGITVFVHGENYTWVVSTVPMISDSSYGQPQLEIVIEGKTKAEAVEEFIRDYIWVEEDLGSFEECNLEYHSYEQFLTNMLDYQQHGRP